MNDDEGARQGQLGAGDEAQNQLTPEDARYAEQLAQHDPSPIGDTPSGTGTLRPTDDIGSGGTADVAGVRDFGGTSGIRTGNVGVGGVLGNRLGDIGPNTGGAGLSQAERGGLDALSGQASSASAEAGPADRAAVERAEERVDLEAGGGLNAAAVQAAGLPGTGDTGEPGLPGTDDLGSAGGADLSQSMGATRGRGRQNPRGQISGVGGTRGSGAGTGHIEDAPGG